MSCPVCNKPTAPAHKPFCSKRCADVDLNRWLSGSYAIPGRDGEAPLPKATDNPDADT